MRRKWRAASMTLAALAGVVAPVTARAQDEAPSSSAGFSSRAANVLVVDNIGGFSYLGTESEGGRAEGRDYAGVFGLTPLTRVGYHRFFGPISIGTGVHFSRTSLDIGLTEGEKTTYLGIAPRIGVGIPFSKSVALWPRAGIGLLNISLEREDTTLVSAAGELLLVVSPVPNFGLTLGPIGEYGFAGENGGRKVHLRSYGVGLGLFADF